MPPYTVKFYLPQKKSVGGSRYASKLSVVGVEDFCKVFFCAALLLKANQGSGKPQTKDYGPIKYDDYPEIWIVIDDDAFLANSDSGTWIQYYNYNPELAN